MDINMHKKEVEDRNAKMVELVESIDKDNSMLERDKELVKNAFKLGWNLSHRYSRDKHLTKY